MWQSSGGAVQGAKVNPDAGKLNMCCYAQRPAAAAIVASAVALM